MSKKIAPTLQAFARDHWFFFETPKAISELRALVAAARAAREEHRFCPTFEKCPTCRALARLDRLSSGTGQRKGRGSRSPEGTEGGR